VPILIHPRVYRAKAQEHCAHGKQAEHVSSGVGIYGCDRR
jgi:hypothetical protein